MAKTTVINAAGQNYAIRQTVDQALKLADTNGMLRLQDGQEAMFIRAQAIQTISEWDSLPTHHGRTWDLTVGSRRSSR